MISRILLAARHRLTSALLERLADDDWERLLDEVTAGRETADGAAKQLIERHANEET